MRMNVKKIRSSKALKLLGLLISSLFIATVSAQVYNYMYIQGSGEATTTGLRWVLGVNVPATASISGSTVTNLNLTTNEGNPRNYTDCLHIENLDPTEDHAFSLEVTQSWGNWTNFQEFNLVLFNSTTGGTEQAVLSMMTTGTVSGLTIPGGETWRILYELIPISDPLTGAAQRVYFEVELVYEASV